MVAVAADHCTQISVMPLGEIFIISLVFRRVDVVSLPPFILRRFPLVKSFIDHQEAHRVAQIVELGHVRIMTAADCVAACFFKDLQTTLPDLARDGGSKRACVMMYTDALKFHRHTVQEESFIRIKYGFADPDALTADQ